MANPYHDEHGKFCSKDQMMGAVLRLQLEGRTADAVKLMSEYQTIIRDQQPNRTAAPTVDSGEMTLEQWNKNHGHLTAGTETGAEQINSHLSKPAWSDDGTPRLKSHLSDLFQQLPTGEPLPENPSPGEFPEFISYHRGVIGHYRGHTRGSALTSDANLLILSHQGGLYGLAVQEAEHPANWQTMGAVFPVHPPTQEQVREKHWEVDSSTEASARARTVFEQTFAPGSTVSDAADAFPYDEENNKYEDLTVESFSGQYLHGVDVRQTVFNIKGKHYIAEEHTSSWDDGRGTLLKHFREAKPVTKDRIILKFQKVGSSTW